MPYLTIFELEGDPDELLEVKRRRIDPVAADAARENGGMAHMVAKTPNGLIVLNLWERPEGPERVAEKVRPIATGVNFPQPSYRREYELVQYETL
jgi:hypothetical protein